MNTSTFESFSTQVAIAFLNVYRTHISPLKGFSCPHRLFYGGESCSDYVKQILINQNLSTAIQRVPQRFRACQVAAQTLNLQKAQSGCIVIPCCLPF